MGVRRLRSIGPAARRPDAKAREPHQVIQHQSVSIEVTTDGRGASTKRLDIRMAIEHVEHVPVLAVTVAHGSTVIAQWPLGESADVLQIFRVFRLMLAIKKVNMRHLPNLLRFIRAGSLPTGKRTRTIRRHMGKAFQKAIGYVPTSKEVLAVMLACRAHEIVADTTSLTALASQGRFEVTAELKAQGVMDAEDHKARAVKIEERFVEMRPQIAVMCEALGIKCDDDVESLVREMIGCGVGANLACAYVAATAVAAMPILGFKSYSPLLGTVIAFEDVDPVMAGLAVAYEAFQWDARVQQDVERQLLGLIHQNNTESLREVETELL